MARLGKLSGTHRDVAKTISFAGLHFAVGFGVSYLFTRSIVIAGGIALVEPLANTLVFYFHERAWRRQASNGVGPIRPEPEAA